MPEGDAVVIGGLADRHREGDRVIVPVAGIRSPGSRGVPHFYLGRHLAELYPFPW